MILEENEKKISLLEQELLACDSADPKYKELKKELEVLKNETYSNLSAWDRVFKNRDKEDMSDAYSFNPKSVNIYPASPKHIP